MPYIQQYNPIIDEIMKISISDLKKIGYLKAGRIGQGVIRWTTRGDNLSGSISITVNMRQLTIDLDYIFKDQPKKYTIHLDAMAANTQYGGKIYHFICPLTSMRSKKLFLIDGVFCHRFSNPRSMYANQIIPKEWRESCKSIQRDALSAAINERINDPRSKKYYQGRETKWFKRAKKLLIKCYN